MELRAHVNYGRGWRTAEEAVKIVREKHRAEAKRRHLPIIDEQTSRLRAGVMEVVTVLGEKSD